MTLFADGCCFVGGRPELRRARSACWGFWLGSEMVLDVQSRLDAFFQQFCGGRNDGLIISGLNEQKSIRVSKQARITSERRAVAARQFGKSNS